MQKEIMRNPLEPIPSPACESAFWTKFALPYYLNSPLQRNENESSHSGLERRQKARMQTESPDHFYNNLRNLHNGNHHVPFERILAIQSTLGWALVRSFSRSPTGLLVRFVDLSAPGLSLSHRNQCFFLLRSTAPYSLRNQKGSLLATVGAWILAKRVIADLSEQVSCRMEDSSLSLFCPPLASSTTANEDEILQLQAKLMPLLDPNPQVLALSLSPTALCRLTDASIHSSLED